MTTRHHPIDQTVSAPAEEYNRQAEVQRPTAKVHGAGAVSAFRLPPSAFGLVPGLLRRAVAGLLVPVLALAGISAAVAAGPHRSFKPGELWPDTDGVHINAHGGGVLWVEGSPGQEGRYYWFGTHMGPGEAGNTAELGVSVYSSSDLYNWTNEGIALGCSPDPASEIFKGGVMERPKVIHNRETGKFVMWFHLELPGQGYTAARAGVAVADQVTGPYQYLGSFRPNAGVWPANVPEEWKQPLTPEEAAYVEGLQLGGGYSPDYPENLLFRRDFAGGQTLRDMTLFVDDDGKAYLVYSGEDNGVLHLAELTDDFLQPSGHWLRLFPKRFHEAPALFKARGRYFLIASGCTGWFPNAARLAVADSLAGPWQELGNPWRGPAEMTDISFDSQSTFVLPVQGQPDAFIFMADRWRPQDAIDGRYVWVPVRWEHGLPYLAWSDEWNLSVFKQTPALVADLYGSARTDDYPKGAGFGFWVPSDGTTINALGYWDEGGDGLAVAHIVALYQYSTNQGEGNNWYERVTLVTVPAGTAAPLVNGYRWVSLPAPVTLNQNGTGGAYYSIQASHGTDTWYDVNAAVTLNPTMAAGFAGSGLVDEGNPGGIPDNTIQLVHHPGNGHGGANMALLTPYDIWSGGAAFNADANGDGVPNGLAFLLGAAGTGVSSSVVVAVSAETEGSLKLVFNILNASNRGTASLSLQHSADLANPWTTVAVPASSGTIDGVTFTITPGTPLDTVQAVISPAHAAGGKLFARLLANP